MRKQNLPIYCDEYDSASRLLKFTDRKPRGGATQQFECVTVTRERTSLDLAFVDGIRKHIEFDPDSGKPRFEDTIFSDGLKRHVEYDPVTGAQTLEVIVHADGYTACTEFDPNTGKRKSQDIKYSDGSQVHAEYDPGSGERRYEEITVAGDGRSDWYRWHIEYDARTGMTASGAITPVAGATIGFAPGKPGAMAKF